MGNAASRQTRRKPRLARATGQWVKDERSTREPDNEGRQSSELGKRRFQKGSSSPGRDKQDSGQIMGEGE